MEEDGKVVEEQEQFAELASNEFFNPTAKITTSDRGQTIDARGLARWYSFRVTP